MNTPKLSIVTPTYNRAHTLDRVYNSLKSQTFKNFEWLVIDDGSTDKTKELVEKFSKDALFSIKYFYKPNGGKHRALNVGFQQAQGDLVLVFDSDDWCLPYALERLVTLWQEIPNDKRQEYSGVSVLKVYLNGKIVGDKFPTSPKLINYIDRYNRRIKGDKWELIRRDLCMAYLYPEITGEKYMAPSYPWIQISRHYKTIFSNEKLLLGDYLSDGISKNNIVFRSGSPKGCCMVYIQQFFISDNLLSKLKSAINYNRFYFHGGYFKNLGIYSLPGMIFGFLLYVYDRIVLSKRKRRIVAV